MDTKGSVDQLGVTEHVSYDSIKKLDRDCAAVESKDAIHLSSPLLVLDNGGASLGPITPYSDKESVDLSHFTSPLTLASSPSTTGFDSHSHQNGDNSYMNEDDDSPCTPREGVFDPFAPGPDKLMLAPHCMKNLEKSRSYVARRLNFSSLMTHNGHAEEYVSETAFEDDTLLETVYDTLLEAIISKQAEDILTEISAIDLIPDVLMTPPSAPRLTGIAETCPGAPLKPVKKSRNIDLSFCRKLEFDF